MAVLHFTTPAASLWRWRGSGLRIIQGFLETIHLPRGNLDFVRVNPLTYGLARTATSLWPDLVFCGNKRPITDPAVIPDRSIEYLPCLLHSLMHTIRSGQAF